jgi:hypothetical protein
MITATFNQSTPLSVRAKNLYDRAKAVLLTNPILAAALDIHKAHIISQIDYWLQNPEAGYIVDGEKWIFNGYSAWAEQLPWMSVDQIGRHIRQLEAQNLIISDNFNNTTRDRRKWYRLNYHAIALLTGWNPRKLKFKNQQEQQPESAPPDQNEDYRFQSVDLQNRICNPADSSISIAYPYPTTLPDESATQYFIPNEDEDDELLSHEEIFSSLSQGQAFHEEPFSAATTEVLSQNTDCHDVQDSVVPSVEVTPKPRRLKRAKSVDSLNGFESQRERDGFYQKLLELGRNKSGIHSPVAWAASIIQSINAGAPCEYLNEYRLNLPVGTCEKREWEIVPGKPLPQFVSYLKRRFLTNAITDEQAIAEAHKALKNPNQAADLWNSCKRTIKNTSAQWQRDEALGVSNAYLPPELLPEEEVDLSEAVEAMEQLQIASLQCSTPCSAPAVEGSQVLALEEGNSDQVPKVEVAQLPASIDLEVIKQELEEKKALLKSGRIGLSVVLWWARAYEGVVELVKDDADQVVDLKLVEQPQLLSDDQPLELPQQVGVENDSIPKPHHPNQSLINCVDESSVNNHGFSSENSPGFDTELGFTPG